MASSRPILLVDDDEHYRAIVGHHFDELGFEVLEAEDGNAACRILSHRPVSLLITDIVMPNAEGLETIIKLRRERFPVKIVAVSGARNSDTYLRAARHLGADAGIDKVRPISELINLVQSVLNSADNPAVHRENSPE